MDGIEADAPVTPDRPNGNGDTPDADSNGVDNDLGADPAEVGAATAEALIRGFDEGVLRNETPVREYLERAGISAEEFANASPDEQAEIIGKGLGVAAFAAVEVVVGSKGAGQLASGKSPDNDTGRGDGGGGGVYVDTGNADVDQFVNSRLESNPQTLGDSEAGNPAGGNEGHWFNGTEFQAFASTLTQRQAVKLDNGSLIDNHGFVYTRNANGSVSSRVATQEQLAQSGIQLDFDNISTANAVQSAVARNALEQKALTHVRQNPAGGVQSTLTPLRSTDPRFNASGFQKFQQTLPGANGKNISVHYQYNPTTGKIVDVKITSPLRNST